jgi:phosphoglycerol transferase MdoB-like AlkP superfamily enzyme
MNPPIEIVDNYNWIRDDTRKNKNVLEHINNENLFNIATPLKARGYEAKFIYGGDGYFDNMNYFFAHNGYETIDHRKFSKDEITFSNAWGVADEDLFDKTIAEADKSHAKGKNFLNFVMTTSNHRPFTYPDNKIDIPSKTNRDGAVKYSDYAIGQLIKKSQNKKPTLEVGFFKNKKRLKHVLHSRHNDRLAINGR